MAQHEGSNSYYNHAVIVCFLDCYQKFIRLCLVQSSFSDNTWHAHVHRLWSGLTTFNACDHGPWTWSIDSFVVASSLTMTVQICVVVCLSLRNTLITVMKTLCARPGIVICGVWGQLGLHALAKSVPASLAILLMIVLYVAPCRLAEHYRTMWFMATNLTNYCRTKLCFWFGHKQWFSRRNISITTQCFDCSLYSVESVWY